MKSYASFLIKIPLYRYRSMETNGVTDGILNIAKLNFSFSFRFQKNFDNFPLEVKDWLVLLNHLSGFLTIKIVPTPPFKTLFLDELLICKNPTVGIFPPTEPVEFKNLNIKTNKNE